MKHKKIIIIFIVITFIIPILLRFLMYAVEGLGLVWLFLQIIYYTPIYLLFPDLFNIGEMGIFWPRITARLLGFVFYSIVFFVVFFLVFHLKKKMKSHER